MNSSFKSRVNSNHIDDQEPFLSPPPTTAIDKLLARRSSSLSKSMTLLSNKKHKVLKTSNYNPNTSIQDRKLNDLSTSSHHSFGQKRPRDNTNVATITTGTHSSKKQMTTHDNTLSLSQTTQGQIRFPKSSIFNTSTDGNPGNDHDFILHFDTLLSPISDQNCNRSDRSSLSMLPKCFTFEAHQIITLPPSSFKNTAKMSSYDDTEKCNRSWSFQPHDEHNELKLTNSEYQMLYEKIHLSFLPKQNTFSTNDHQIIIQDRTIHTPSSSSSQPPLSLTTLNIILSTMNAGILISCLDQSNPCSWYILISQSISQSKLIHLPFLELSNLGNTTTQKQLSSIGQEQLIRTGINIPKKQKGKVMKVTPMKNDNDQHSNNNKQKPTSSCTNNKNNFQCKEICDNLSKSTSTLSDFDVRDYKSKWNDVTIKYKAFLLNDNTSILESESTSERLTFVQNELYPLLQKIVLSGMNADSVDTNEPIIDTKNLLNTLLRESILLKNRDESNNAPTEENLNSQNDKHVSLLMTKAELMSFIMNRKIRSNFSTKIEKDEGDNTDKDKDNDNGVHLDSDKFYQQLLEFQILFRLELYALFYCQDQVVAMNDICLQYGDIVRKKKNKRKAKGKVRVRY